jgi:hypothetical protein
MREHHRSWTGLLLGLTFAASSALPVAAWSGRSAVTDRGTAERVAQAETPTAEEPTPPPTATEPAPSSTPAAPDTETPTLSPTQASTVAPPSPTETATNPPALTDTETSIAVGPASVVTGGDITSLTGTGAQPPSNCIEIDSTVHAHERIVRSNLFYALILPGSSAWWRTTRYQVPSLNAGEDWSPPTWSVCNPPQQGTYTILACWSTGNNNTNCNIDAAYTSFYSVPTLGFSLTLTAAGMLAAFLWRNRKRFARGGP